jgi:uncharacterized membrane protein YcaP (DUF421 family)
MLATEAPTYMMPQAAPAAILKGRPVSSLEEARVAQIDLDGSLSIFPDLGNQKIYTKRINADGTASLLSYSLDTQPVETQNSEYVSKKEFAELKQTIDALVNKLTEQKPKATVNQPLNF